MCTSPCFQDLSIFVRNRVVGGLSLLAGECYVGLKSHEILDTGLFKESLVPLL